MAAITAGPRTQTAWQEPTNRAAGPSSRPCPEQAALRRHACSSPFGALQAKLVVGEPGDRFEAEAERVAAEVLRAQDAAVQSRAATPRAISAVRDSSLRGQPLEAHEEVAQSTRNESQVARGRMQPSACALDASAGSRMPGGLQTDMEQRFGADFSAVRLHTDSRSTAMCGSIAAKAFTHRNHIYFADGQFNPRTAAGRHTIAHELTHTIQQNAAPLTSRTAVHQTLRQDGGQAATIREGRRPTVSPSAAAPAIQLLKVTAGGFGRALEEYTDVHNVQDDVVRLLRRSPTFMQTARVLDRHFVWRTDSFDWESGHPSRVLQYDAQHTVTNGPPGIRGRRELMVVGGGSGAAFMDVDAPANPLSSDIIVLNPKDTEDFLRSIAHEAAHARNFVGQTGPPPATLAAAVTAGIQEETGVRATEQQVVGELTGPAARLNIAFGQGPTTIPAEVEREYSPGLGLTYLENIFFLFRLRETQASEGLSDDEAQDIRRRVDAGMPAAPFILGERPSATSGLFELSQYAETYFDYKTARNDWSALRQRVPPGSPGFAAQEERLRADHARRFFGGRVAYRALPVPAAPANPGP